MNKLDKFAFRKIKESGNYKSLLEFKKLKPRVFKYNRLYFIYCGLINQEKFCFKNGETLKHFLEKNSIKFVF